MQFAFLFFEVEHKTTRNKNNPLNSTPHGKSHGKSFCVSLPSNQKRGVKKKSHTNRSSLLCSLRHHHIPSCLFRVLPAIHCLSNVQNTSALPSGTNNDVNHSVRWCQPCQGCQSTFPSPNKRITAFPVTLVQWSLLPPPKHTHDCPSCRMKCCPSRASVSLATISLLVSESPRSLSYLCRACGGRLAIRDCTAANISVMEARMANVHCLALPCFALFLYDRHIHLA